MEIKAMGFKPVKFSIEDLTEAAENSGGFCIKCGEGVESGVEPDAENYHCESCGADQVFGAAEIVLKGLIKTNKEVA